MKKSNYRKLIEACIGRKLSSEETVHHIDGNHYNNNIDNMYVFKTRRSHMLYHLKMGTLILGVCNVETDERIAKYVRYKIMPLRLVSNVHKLMLENNDGK